MAEKQKYTVHHTQFELSPASNEQGFCFTHLNAPIDRACIGHLRGDFGETGTGFYHTWWPHNAHLVTPSFKTELDDVITGLRQNGLLKDRKTMLARSMRFRAAIISTEGRNTMAFRIETQEHLFYLRCIPNKGEYNFYCYGYNKTELMEVLRQQKKLPRISWAELDSSHEVVAICYGESGYHKWEPEGCIAMTSTEIVDKLITTLLQQVPYIILTMDFVPIETEDAYKTLADYRMKVDADKVRFNRKSVDNLDFTANVPQRTQEEENTLNQWQRDMTDNDQQMFLTLLTVAYFADDLEELRQETDALKTAAGNYNCRFTEMRWQQENTFNTAMPYGLRRIANLRAMTTKGVASLIPFNTQEVLVPGGIYYGVNAISGNIIIGLRTVLINGNAMVIATSGGGKSLFVKQEILELFLRFLKAKFYIVDPENEYGPLVRELGGIVVDIAVDSTTYFNPLDFTYDPSTKIQPHTVKAEFVLSLCEQIMGKDNIQAGDKSLIDRSLKHIYKPLIKSGYKDACPTLTDLYNDLKEQPHERAHEIALALELFATGSMNMFAHPTNVDMSNRLICFNIQSLGDQLKPVAMLSMLEYINTCVMSNERNDPKAATWVYFDEIYLLLRDKLSAQFLYTSWKRFRKYNAYATGITQNVQDCLANDTAYAMLANSEFVCMLRQTKDIDSVVELYGLSEPQKNYLKLAKPGQGILKMGNNLIPFVNDHPTNTKIYRLLTTKPGEMEN